MDRDEQIEKITQAVLWALMTANEQPYPLAVPAAKAVATMMVDCGVRQTDEIAEKIELPNWVTERVREQTTGDVPVPPDIHEPQETPRVVEAPPCPSRIAKSKMGVVVQ